MKEKNILHITDFHINDYSVSSKEYLRKDYYEKYLNELIDQINNNCGKIDCIIATGDFIHQGATKNFRHASKILEHLYTNLHLNESNVGICIGNHDIVVKEDSDGKYVSENRQSYYNFEKKYANIKKSLISKPNKRFKVCLLSDEIYFLSLDSTLGRERNQPGKLSKEEVNIIINTMRNLDFDHPNHLLVIGSHYPVTYFDDIHFPDEDGWYDKHFWRSCGYLRDRIHQTMKQSNILWLFGDTHEPGLKFDKNQLFVMSGRIGTKIEERGSLNLSQINRQVRIINYKEDNSTNIQEIQYQQKHHDECDQDGKWVLNFPEKIKYAIQNAELIDATIQDRIINRVKSNQLYNYGRFVINDDEVSLGWISVNNLLAERSEIIPQIVTKSSDWLNSKITDFYNGNSLLIGIDFWGAIIASHISIISGNRNYCKASRGSDRHYSLNELFNPNAKDLNIKNITSIIIISDVVSSGRTIARFYNVVKDIIKKERLPIPDYYALSVISDRLQQRKTDLSFLSAFGTFCNNIRLPIVDVDFLPDEDILPSIKYFI